MSRLMDRAERVKTEIPISKVLTHYGYRVDDRDPEREQVFPCDLHGDGHDVGPSAKMYSQSSSNSFYCWGCGRVRDSIALVRDKQNLSFAEAISFLEKLYDLPTLPWKDEPREKPPAESVLKGVFDTPETVDDILKRISRFILNTYTDGSLPPERCSVFWEAYDKLNYLLGREAASSDRIKHAALVLFETLKKEMNIV